MGHVHGVQALDLGELAQVELQRELAAHVAQRQEGGQRLCQHEEQVDGVHGPLQRGDEDALVGHEEQQDGQLEEEGEEPEAGQLWHLMKEGMEMSSERREGEREERERERERRR